jgi:hypothetical protein
MECETKASEFDLATRFGLLYRLKDEDRIAVCNAIAEACEQSFRRGFMQGWMGSGDVEVDVMDWRFNTPLSESPSPHGTYDNSSLARHTHEIGLPSSCLPPVES